MDHDAGEVPNPDGQRSEGNDRGVVCCPSGLLGPEEQTERSLFRCCSSGGAAPLVTAVLASSPTGITAISTAGPSILTTVHPDGLRLGVCRR